MARVERRYRWVVLAAGTFAQAPYAAMLLGLAVIAPRDDLHSAPFFHGILSEPDFAIGAAANPAI